MFFVSCSAFRHPVWSVETLCAYYFTQKKTSGSVGVKRTKGKTHTKKISPMMRRAAAQQLGCNSLVLLYFSPGNENPPPQRVTADITALQGWHTQSLQNTSAFFHNLRDLFKSCLAKTSPGSSIVPQITSNTWKNDEMMLKLAGLTSTRNYMQLIGRYLKSW